MEYFIPHDSSELLKRSGLKAKNIDNFSLRFNRFTKRDYNDNKNKYEFNLRDINFSFDRQLDKIDKQRTIIKNLYVDCESIEVENNWRLAMGIGSVSVYETSITLHHIYGIPFIPAQSIKGSFRSYIIENYFDSDEEKAFEDKGFVTVFGSNDNQGKVIFFDAFTKESEIKMDIMNNHYQNYYNGSQAPNDTQNPNPVNFMTLKNAKFQITIASKENIKIKDGLFKDKDILTLVKEELSNALEVFGIGAKTAVGYGYFKIIKSEEDKHWDRVKDTKDIQIVEAFVKKYPDSKYLDTAHKKIEAIKKELEKLKLLEGQKEAIEKWEAVLKVDKKYKQKALEDYIQNYPDSSKLSEAKKELENLSVASKPQPNNKKLDFSQANDGKSIERVMKSVQNPNDKDKDLLEEAIKRIYPSLNAKKKKQFIRSSKLMVKWLGQDRFDKIIKGLDKKE